MTDKIEVLTAEKAAKILSENGVPMSPNTLRLALEQRRFTWGWTVIDPEDGHTVQCWILKHRLDEWIQEQKM